MQPVLRTLAVIGLLQLALCVSQGQNSDNSGLPSQDSAPVQITPAPSNPSSNTPLEPIFPQSAPQSALPALSRSLRDLNPNGPASGAGLGYGPIRPGDIVEVRVFDAPEYSVSMPVSPAGLIAIPYAGLFHIEGMTSIEAAKAIAQLFVQTQILRDPPGDCHHATVRLQRDGDGRSESSRNLRFGGQEAAYRYAYPGWRRDQLGGTCNRNLCPRLI